MVYNASMPGCPGETFLFTQAFKAVPMQAVKDALVTTANNDLRERELPKRSVAYFVIGLGLLSGASYQEVYRHLQESRNFVTGRNEPINIPVKSALVQARQRLGYASMKEIFDQVVRPIAVPEKSQGCFFKGLRLTAIDGTLLNVQATDENDDYFGRPKSQFGDGAYPQVRCVGLVECGTRIMFDFELSDSDTRSEQALAERLLPRVQRGQLLLADRLYCDGRKWRLATMNGADAIFRAKADTSLPVEKRLADGSYMSTLSEGDSRKSSAKFHPVRVIEYRLGRKDPVYRLITTLSPDHATPEEIAHLYLERWNWEEVAGELKTALNPSNDVLRSNTPELVKQEFVGKLIAHFCVRSFMHEAALVADLDPDRLSFKHSLNVLKRKAAYVGDFSP
jgi:hypothetical protein